MPAQPQNWDEGPGSVWDTGFWDPSVAPIVDKIMNAQVALNTTHLKPADRMAKFDTRITQCGTTPALTNPNPPLAECTAASTAAKAAIGTVDQAEKALTNLRIVRDQLVAVADNKHALLGACVQDRSGGDPAFIAGTGFDVAGAVSPAPKTPHVLNLVLTHGDLDGSVDAAWNRDRQALSYEVQTSPDPITATSFIANQTAPKSSCSILNQPIGAKVWVRVRAIHRDGPGGWSEPAFIIIS